MLLAIARMRILGTRFECVLPCPDAEFEERYTAQMKATDDVREMFGVIRAFEREAKTGAFWESVEPDGPDVSCTSEVYNWFHVQIKETIGLSSATVLKRAGLSPYRKRAA